MRIRRTHRMPKRQRCDSDNKLNCPSFSAAACICCEGFLAEGLLKKKCNRCRCMPFLLDAKGHCYPSGSSVLMEATCPKCDGFQPPNRDMAILFDDWEQATAVMQACAGCGATPEETTTLYKCSGCMLACYCSENCQVLHWDPLGDDTDIWVGGHWRFCTSQMTSRSPRRRIKAIRRRLRYLKRNLPFGLVPPEEYGPLVLWSTEPVKFAAMLESGVYCLLTFKEISTATSTPVTLELKLNETGQVVPAYKKVFLTKAAAVRWIFDADPDHNFRVIVDAWLRTSSVADEITMTPIW